MSDREKSRLEIAAENLIRCATTAANVLDEFMSNDLGARNVEIGVRKAIDTFRAEFALRDNDKEPGAEDPDLVATPVPPSQVLDIYIDQVTKQLDGYPIAVMMSPAQPPLSDHLRALLKLREARLANLANTVQDIGE